MWRKIAFENMKYRYVYMAWSWHIYGTVAFTLNLYMNISIGHCYHSPFLLLSYVILLCMVISMQVSLWHIRLHCSDIGLTFM